MQIDNLNDFVGNKFTVKKVKENIDKGLNVILFGPIGSGKTTLCQLIIKKLNRPILELNKETKDIIHSIKTFLGYRTIDTFIDNNYKNNDKIIFIEDVDTCITTDKSLLTNLIMDVLPRKVQLLITCGMDIKKKVQDVFKDRFEFATLTYPSERDIIHFFSKKVDTDILEKKIEHVKKLITNYKGCIRDILMHVNFEVMDEKSQLKDMNTFDIIKYMFSTSMISQKDIIYIYQNDSCNIIHTILENIPDELCGHRCCDASEYIKLLDMFIETSKIETHAFCNTEWKLFDLVALCRLNNIKDILNSHHHESTSTTHILRHSQMLSKLSHHNIFNKKMQALKQHYMVDDYILLTSLQESKDETYITTTYKKYFQPIQ